MRAIVYTETGGPDVLKLVERPDPAPSPDEVLVRVAVSGVNPTDWKARRGDGPGKALAFPEVVPNMDGAGTIVALGDGVDPGRVGERVWLWEAARHRPNGSAQELVALPAAQAVPLSEGASFDLGASIGIPALTAHRCLTVGVDGPAALGPHALDGRTVLVAGGAGAVGHAAIELAVWSGATVITTVSTPEKEVLAAAAFSGIGPKCVPQTERRRAPTEGGVSRLVQVPGSQLVRIDPLAVRDLGAGSFDLPPRFGIREKVKRVFQRLKIVGTDQHCSGSGDLRRRSPRRP